MINFDALADRFAKVKLLRLIQLTLSIAAVVLAAIGPTRIIGFVLAAVMLALYFGYSRRITKEYCNEVLRLNIVHGLCEGMKDPRAEGSGSLSEEVFDAWQMLPRREGKGESILSRNGFACGLGEKTLHGAETTVHYGVASGKGDKQSYHFLSGTALWCEGGEAGDWLLLHKNWIHPAVQQAFLEAHGYHTVETGAALAADFHLLSHDAEAVLPEELEKELEKLAKETVTLGALRLSKAHNAVFLLSRFYAPKIHSSAMPTERELKTNTLPERDLVFPILKK